MPTGDLEDRASELRKCRGGDPAPAGAVGYQAAPSNEMSTRSAICVTSRLDRSISKPDAVVVVSLGKYQRSRCLSRSSRLSQFERRLKFGIYFGGVGVPPSPKRFDIVSVGAEVVGQSRAQHASERTFLEVQRPNSSRLRAAATSCRATSNACTPLS